MRRLFLTALIPTCWLLSACSLEFSAFMRNLSTETAIIDVFLLDKSEWNRLPNKVKVANRIVEFKNGVRGKFDSLQIVIWVDTSHFRFEMKPQTSLDFTDMAGEFLNSHPRRDVRVVVTTSTSSDTILNGYRNFRSENFQYTNFGLKNPTLYYDVKP